ncbi:MAG: glycosyltransferase family 1 protein, partial [Dehalococcoidia bacterium]|nr:glycosyltransferase family 1 protein [Dehalococcoidia bacterium]
ALVEAISGLLHNPERRKHLGEMGRRRVAQMFNWQNTAKRTAEIYEEAIQYQNHIKAE